MPAWDNTLPSPKLSSYHNRDNMAVLVTELESGPPDRVRYSAHYLTIGQFTLIVDPTQYVAFAAMYNGSNQGADWLTGTPLDTGNGIQPHRVRLTSVQRKVLTPPNLLWEITCGFETDEHN